MNHTTVNNANRPATFLQRMSQTMTWAMAAVMVSAISGCASGNYQAESLPSSLRIAASVNPKEIDLSRLASNGVSSRTIGPGDVLDVTIAAALSTDETLNLPAAVDSNGRVEIVGAGFVRVAGLEPDGAAAAIRAKVVERGLYMAPQVTVLMKSQKQNYVRVIGAVKEPGLYALPPGRSDLLSAIVEAGGLADDADSKVEIRNPTPAASGFAGSGDGMIRQASYGHSIRPSPEKSFGVPGQLKSRTINLSEAALSGTGSYNVEDGGVVMVRKSDPQPISIIGLVNKPDIYDFPIGEDVNVLTALGMAGGLSNKLANKIFVIRPLAGQEDPAVIQVSLREAKKSGKSNIRLAPGDTVSVEASPSTVVMDALQIIRFGVNGSLSTLF